MGSPTTAQDFLDAVEDVLDDLGDTRVVRITTYGVIDPADPGAGPSVSTTDYNVDAVLYDYQDRQIDGTAIQQGDRQAVLAVDSLSSAVIAAILPGAKLVDGSTVYSIVRASPVEVAGETVTIFLQIRS
jgi:hypothetical protein